jgi:transposase-like protein
MHTHDGHARASTRAAATDRPATRRRRFTPEDRRQALAVVGECGGNLTKAAARLGLDVPLLSKWRTEAIRASQAARAAQSAGAPRAAVG